MAGRTRKKTTLTSQPVVTSGSSKQNAANKPAKNPAVDPIFTLQRTIGNRAVSVLLHSGYLQTKLAVGQPGDSYEREADSVAQRVVSMPKPAVQRSSIENDTKIQKSPAVSENSSLCLPVRVIQHLDKPIKYSGVHPLSAVITSDGIVILFNDGGELYVDRSSKPLDASILTKIEEDRREESIKGERWYQTLLRWLGPSPSVASMVEAYAEWELSDRLYIIDKIAKGGTIKDVLDNLDSLNESNFQVLVTSAAVIPIVASIGLMPAPAGTTAGNVVSVGTKGVGTRALKRAGLNRMAAVASSRQTALMAVRDQATKELARARLRGGPVIVNIGGKGEVKGAINLNPNFSSVENMPSWPNWVNGKGEEIAHLFPPGSIDEVCSVKLWAGVSWPKIVEGIKFVLKPGGKVSLNQLGPVKPIVDALEKAGFKDIKVIADALVEAVR